MAPADSPTLRVVSGPTGAASVGWDAEWGCFRWSVLTGPAGRDGAQGSAESLTELDDRMASITGAPMSGALRAALGDDAVRFPCPREPVRSAAEQPVDNGAGAPPLPEPDAEPWPAEPPEVFEDDHPGWVDLIEPTLEDLLAELPTGWEQRPTLGAIRRQQGAEGPSEHAKVALAMALAEQALAVGLEERIVEIVGFLRKGATPDQVVARLVDLVDDYHGRGTRLTRGELAQTRGTQFVDRPAPGTLAARVAAATSSVAAYDRVQAATAGLDELVRQAGPSVPAPGLEVA